ncbi:hypothetical protein KCP73_07905 [Salmonella enterica subsp. enterica]|nr:hypothetical protein KCP73_07905 [Salmonella enterica subsp. enterica]
MADDILKPNFILNAKATSEHVVGEELSKHEWRRRYLHLFRIGAKTKGQ